MNIQEMFNKIWDWTITKNHPQCSDSRVCLYRGPEGNKCFIGVLIPDELYTRAMENMCPETFLDFHSNEDCDLTHEHRMALFEAFGSPDDSDIGFLNHLQSIHDVYFDERDRELRKLARNLGLTIPTKLTS